MELVTPIVNAITGTYPWVTAVIGAVAGCIVLTVGFRLLKRALTV